MNHDKPQNLHDFEDMARLNNDLAQHVYGQSYDGVSYFRNMEIWKEYQLLPRYGRDVSAIDTSTTILGKRYPVPFGIAPMGHIGLIHPRGELELVENLLEGMLYTAATVATYSMEEVAEAYNGPKWWQLYFLRDREKTKELVQRAEAAGYEAIVVTVDSPVVGWREQTVILDQKFGNLGEKVGGDEIREFVRDLLDPSFTWKDLEWLRTITSLPIIVKGSLAFEDWKEAVDHGSSAIWISNHGGRQLDRAPTALEQLDDTDIWSYYCKGTHPSEYLGVEFYVDGGVRRGLDIITALALGAKAVFIGRPVLYALAYYGGYGLRDMLNILTKELEKGMALLGTPTIKDITGDFVRKL